MTERLCYEIRVEEHLDEHWSAWFDGWALTHSDDNTTALRGPVADQAALHGILNKIRDLGMTLLFVQRLDPGEAEPENDKGEE
jgi:hypothetical protein